MQGDVHAFTKHIVSTYGPISGWVCIHVYLVLAHLATSILYSYTPWPRQQAGYQQGIFWIYARLSDWLTDICRVHRYTHERLIGRPIAMDSRYKIVIPHGLGLLPKCNYFALDSPRPRIIFWLSSLSLGYNSYPYVYSASCRISKLWNVPFSFSSQ